MKGLSGTKCTGKACICISLARARSKAFPVQTVRESAQRHLISPATLQRTCERWKPASSRIAAANPSSSIR
eukprot:3758184-Rhodomonas_salina.2